jgi:cobalt-precorrin-5B (C1)-methyltransferase
VEVGLPDGTRARLAVEGGGGEEREAWASVRKDAGDDPDVTHGCLVVASVRWGEGTDVVLAAGDGVGSVTKPGLSVSPGEPAINPVPRRMIRDAVRDVTQRGVRVTVSIPGGERLAQRTFNPRLGVEGGLSILGTSGLVRPFSHEALRDALRCSLSVAAACGVSALVFVPGRIGERAARKHFKLSPEQLVEVSNEWGFMLDLARSLGFERLLVLGHPGKLAKLSEGEWDTHSSRSRSAAPMVARLALEILGGAAVESPTAEGIFAALPAQKRQRLGDALAARVRSAVSHRLNDRLPVAVALVDMRGNLLGEDGDLSPWR